MSEQLAVGAADFDDKVINSDKPVLVDFWATWCRPCVAIAPHIEAIADEYADKAGVYKVDVDQNRELGEKYRIMSIPALIMFKGGQEVDRMVGVGSKEQIAAFVDKNL